jgi:hypothetical protein
MKQHYPLAAATAAASVEEWPGGLIPLPRDYADLMNLAGDFTCDNSVTGRIFFCFLCIIRGSIIKGTVTRKSIRDYALGLYFS